MMWICALVCALLIANSASAEVASDNELYAAYCIGVLQVTQQEGRKASDEFEQTLADDK